MLWISSIANDRKHVSHDMKLCIFMCDNVYYRETLFRHKPIFSQTKHDQDLNVYISGITYSCPGSDQWTNVHKLPQEPWQSFSIQQQFAFIWDPIRGTWYLYMDKLVFRENYKHLTLNGPWCLVPDNPFTTKWVIHTGQELCIMNTGCLGVA
jgi:hypothetical protein